MCPAKRSRRKPEASVFAYSSARRGAVHWVVLLGVLAVIVVVGIAVWMRGFVPQHNSGGESRAVEDTTADRPTLPVGFEKNWQEWDDPSRDGWRTEAFAQEAEKQLKAFGNLLISPASIDADAVARLVADEFTCDPLSPNSRRTVFEDDTLMVERLAASGGPPSDTTALAPAAATSRHRGALGLAAALKELMAPFDQASDIQVKFKVHRVSQPSGEFTTEQLFALSGRTQTQGNLLEQNATWTIRWAPQHDKGPPQMKSIRLDAFEQVTTKNASDTLFADCTRSLLGQNVCYAEQLMRGLHHWLERMQQTGYFLMLGTPGIAIGDVNGDGREDLYLCQEEGLPNRLFLQQPDGTALEVSAEWGVDWLADSRGVLLIDLDNDGDQDLVVAVLGGVVLAENEQQRRLRFRQIIPTTDDMMSLAAADYDQDGWLDLYVCSYSPNRLASEGQGLATPAASSDFVYNDANDGGSNHLLRNEMGTQGTWHFTDVTRRTGLDQKNRRWSFAAAWEDYDNDGDLDLYVANDYGRDNLFRNDGDVFAEVSNEAGAEDAGSGMGISWADYDRDGWMDVHISNMFSAAGNRIALQPEFKADDSKDVKRRLQRLARGNTLLRNAGNETFHDVSAASGIEMGRWAWSSNFCDLNNDGWEDLVVANGYMTTEDTGDL